MRKYPGFFLSLEGGEGGGKTTQLLMLMEWLESLSLKILRIREPGTTRFGEEIRRLLLHTNGDSAPVPRAELLLFNASFAQTVELKIIPALQAGVIVVADRYFDSNRAYQGYARGFDVDAIKKINLFATGGLKPNITLLFDLEPEVGLARRQGTGEVNRLDAEYLDFHLKVMAGYRALAAAEPKRWRIIDASQTIEVVQAQVRKVVSVELYRHGLLRADQLPDRVASQLKARHPRIRK